MLISNEVILQCLCITALDQHELFEPCGFRKKDSGNYNNSSHVTLPNGNVARLEKGAKLTSKRRIIKSQEYVTALVWATGHTME